MTNRENLRDRYEKYWPLTAKREEHIKNMLEKALKVKVEPYGLGAMSTERIKGSAKENGCDTADPDLYVTEYDFFVEVTGPIPHYIHPKDALFVNPCKVKNARRKAAKAKDVWLVHVLDRNGIRKQIFDLVGDILPKEIEEILSSFCLTDTARCHLGRMCSKTRSPEDKESLLDKILYYHKKTKLVTKRKDGENSIIRCFLMDESYAEEYLGKPNVVLRSLGEKFVSVPSYDKRIVSFDDMIACVKESRKP